MKDQHEGRDRDSFERELARRTIAGNRDACGQLLEHYHDPVCGCMKDQHEGRDRDSFERELARQAIAGNRDAYRQLLEHYYDPVSRLYVLLVGDFKAYGLTNTLFDYHKFKPILSTYDEIEVFKIWLYRQALRRWDRYKAARPIKNIYFKRKRLSPGQEWWEYIIRLPATLRTTVALLFCDEEFTHAEIGWILKEPDEPGPIPEGTISWRWFDAKRRWKEME